MPVRLVFFILVFMFEAVQAIGQTLQPKETAPPPETPQTPPTAKPDAALPGPRYFNLRFDEDFSYLDGEPGTYREDFFDPIKNIRFGEDWRLSVGGEFRFRLEAETNKLFDANARTQDTFQLYRYLLHLDLKYRDAFRVFAQGIAAFDEDRGLPPRPIDENRWDLQQLFTDLRVAGEDVPLTLRMGRQELQYGKQRWVSPLEWANVRRRFDGVKAMWEDERWQLDAWYAKPVVVKPRQGDDWDEQFDFYGAYFTYKGIPRHGIDVYALGTHKTGSYLNPNGKVGDESRFMLGSRFWGATGPWDYEAEVAGQWGHWAGDTIQAWNISLEGGHVFTEAPWKPRIGAGFDRATGDKDPRDSKVGTIDQLFPLGHALFGYLDLIGRNNITAVNVNLSAWPVEKQVRSELAFHSFWLTEDKDALYSAAGRPVRRDPTGTSGSEVGHELDLTILWNVDVHSKVLFGYSHFWDGDFISNTGKSEDPDLFYVQFQYKF
ncbi:MAG: alginate export family protein [Phycisphaerales bacterium]|nr:MAG: alginate export family protein [Phycisphaerales bacterium]